MEEMDYEDKFFVWGRKIVEEVLDLEDRDVDFEKIVDYLKECIEKREEFLDPNDLTDFEENYTLGECHDIFEKYQLVDPIYEAIK
jgi:hypothetical protein